jgi:hypothetical protein
VGITHNAEDSNRERRSLTLLFLRRGEKEAARGVDGVAGSLALPATISRSVCIRRGRGRGSMEEIKKEWSCCRAQQDQPKGRDRRCDDEHDNIPRQDSERRGD